MELDWSEQSSHIRTLFRPWQPGDGYDEATLQAPEVQLGLRLPATLRTFYLVWGRRRDLTQLIDPLLAPDALQMRTDTLVFGGRIRGPTIGGYNAKRWGRPIPRWWPWILRW
jgi:hypothetical protein